jgi:predicted MFS family arabinose efflux permease
VISKQRERTFPPAAFFFAHLCSAWPVGIVGLAMGSSLVKAGVSVQQTATIIAASTLAFTLEFLWAPIVDSYLTRRSWYIGGATVMCGCIVALLLAPWDASSVPMMSALAFASSSGAAVASVALKGIMAHEVPATKLGSASGYYTAGGAFAKVAGGAGTIWLLTHLQGRTPAVILSLVVAAVGYTAILFTRSGEPAPWLEFPARLRNALAELWAFVRTRQGIMTAVLCVIPFGAGTEIGLIGAIAREWTVTPDQLASFSILGAVTGIAGAIFAGWLSRRVGPWRVYLLFGWTMVAVMLCFAFTPRAAAYFLAVELLYRGLASGCTAALLGIVMTAIGKGAASTKAASLWSLANFAIAYPALLEGSVHDRAGTSAMLLTDAGLGAVGFIVMLIAARLLKLRLYAPTVAPAHADTPE